MEKMFKKLAEFIKLETGKDDIVIRDYDYDDSTIRVYLENNVRFDVYMVDFIHWLIG